MQWDTQGGGGRARSGDLVIGTSGDRKSQNPKTLPLINADDTDLKVHLMPGMKECIPGDELCKCFGILVGVVGGRGGIAVIAVIARNRRNREQNPRVG